MSSVETEYINNRGKTIRSSVQTEDLNKKHENIKVLH